MFLTSQGAGALGGEEHEQTVPDEPKHGGKIRRFTVHAIEVDLVYNRYGLHQPNAAIYVLDEDLDAAREASGKVPCGNSIAFEDDPRCDTAQGEDTDAAVDGGGVCDEVPAGERATGRETRVLQPLSLRVNRGDIVEVEFVNHLDRRASIHQTALPYEVRDSDGMHVGLNPDTTAGPGESITYRWFAANPGTHFFLDGANQAFDSADAPPEEANLLSRGLFGSISVFPPGTTWTDPYTGESVQGRVQADIHIPDPIPDRDLEHGFVPGVSFRQIRLYYHTPEGIETAEGEELTFPGTDEPQTTHAINYRADPTGSRVPNAPVDPETAEEFFYDSWIHGDPGGGDNVYPVYTGDPMRVTAVAASVEENHVHHLHNHRWKETAPDPRSDTIDSQTIGLGAVYETPIVPAFGEPEGAIDDFDTVRPGLEFEDAFQVGAGGSHQGTGDILFHCHLFPHYGEGMWGMVRVFDKERKQLRTLPDNDPPLPADSDVPGFPDFIPGEFGQAPPYPPYGAAGVDGFRNPEPGEEAALTRSGPVVPGAPYTDPCEPDIGSQVDGTTREYTIVALPADIVYNDAGDHDPEGKVFVLEEDAEQVRDGDLNPEPLVIRANVGDCVEITLRNELPGGKSNHIHFVSYDPLGSDGLTAGYNYRQDVQPGEELQYRWFADEEGTIFFHDHITGIDDVMNGTFASIIVEPQGSEWLDPHTGEPVRSGTQAIIRNPDGDDYREFCLAYQDFAQLRDRDGEFVNPNVEHNENEGVMAINYRNAPYYRRGPDPDPAYLHSSYVHGDPETPVLEAYEDDPVRIRLWQAAYEEQHGFHVHGRHIEPEGVAPEDTVSQIVGTSEAFTFDILPEEDNPEQVAGTDGDGALRANPDGLPIRDYLYGSTVTDDLWDGMWGIHRTFGAEVAHLEPLPDRGAPDGQITEQELRDLGHPAPYSTPRWTEAGHEAKLIYDADDDRQFPPDRDARRNAGIDGDPPPQPPRPGDACPPGAPVREFDVSAFQTTIPYNEYDDVDPFGTVFALDEHVDDIRAGRREPTPLSLWVTRGDCIDLTLTNRLDPDEFADHPHPQMRTPEGDEEWERSERVSLHASHVNMDVLASDGTTVGFNYDQTVGPGESITYRWYVDDGTDSSVMWDFADIRSTRHHGAFGQLVVAPTGSEFLDQYTGEPLVQGRSTSGILKTADGPDRRHFAALFADGQHIINADDPDDCVVPPGPDVEEPDAPCPQIGEREDQGYLSVNYRAEPFVRRFQRTDDEQANVYASDVHGDPATPVFRAVRDDPVNVQVSLAADKARGIAFHLAAHQWNRFRGVPASDDIGVDDRFIPAKGATVQPFGDAGGLADSVGDHIYQETKQRRRLESGAWGIFRVRKSPYTFARPLHPLPDREQGTAPENRPGWRVARGNATGGTRSDLLVGVPGSDVTGPDAGAVYLLRDVGDDPVPDLLDHDVRFLSDGGPRIGERIAFDDGAVVIDAGDDCATMRYVFHDVGGLGGDVDVTEADEVRHLDG